MKCLDNVACISLGGVGEILSGVGSHEARPRSIISSLDGAQAGGLDREAS